MAGAAVERTGYNSSNRYLCIHESVSGLLQQFEWQNFKPPKDCT